MQTTPVRIDNDVLGMVRSHKEATGVPMQRFIEDAIVEKIEQLPVSVKEKMGLKKEMSSYASTIAPIAGKAINGTRKNKRK